MHRIVLVSGIVVLTASTGNAGSFAAPIIDPAPVTVANTSDWQGGYAGVSLGYSFGSDDPVDIALYEGNELLHSTRNIGKTNVAGPTFGLSFGYRWQRDNWVFGPEVWAEGGAVKDSNRIVYNKTIDLGPNDVFDLNINGRAESKVNSLVGLQFKGGYLVRPETLVYGTVGVARGSFDLKMSDGGLLGRKSYTANGYTFGLGAEQKIRKNVSVFAEWQYRDFSKTNVDFRVGEDDVTRTVTMPGHHNIKAGVNFKF